MAGVAVCEDVADAGHPVVALGLREMADDVVGSPCVVSFVAAGPGVGEAAEEGIESRRGAGEESDGLGHGRILCGSRIGEGGCGPKWLDPRFLVGEAKALEDPEEKQRQRQNAGVSPLRDGR